MKLLRLTLENFQGIKSLELEFDGSSAAIYGDNATGKTTVFNALTWLLFDRASTGAKNYTPKTKDATGDVHFLNHSASATFAMEDGRIVALRKAFHENYKRKRGSATEEFDGHSVEFFVDDVPVKEKDYISTLNALCGGAEAMKILTMPNYFSEIIPWDARRRLLLEVCGDISYDEIMAAHPELADLNNYLTIPGTDRRYEIDEYKKIAAAQKTKLNKELEEIPSRIDEAEKAIPDSISNETADSVCNALNTLRAEHDSLIDKRAAILNGSQEMAAKAATATAEMEIREARLKYKVSFAETNTATIAAIRDIQEAIYQARHELNEANNEVQRLERIIERTTNRREELLAQYNAVAAETWDTDRAVCPTCHRELPPERIEELRGAFEADKNRRIQEINRQGEKEASRTMISEMQEQLQKQRDTAASAENTLKSLQAEYDAKNKSINQPAPFEGTEEFKRLTAHVAECRANEEQARKDTTEAVKSVEEEIKATNTQIAATEEKRAAIIQTRTQLARINSLKSQEKELAAQYEAVEKGLYLCEEFTKIKVASLTDKINNHFKSVRFRLFVEQINGGIKDDCEVMIPSDTGRLVPYTFANNAARINAGLEIIDVLSKHWGITMPVFIDNAESITHIANVETQVIRLVVSEPDKALRLETEGGAA